MKNNNCALVLVIFIIICMLAMYTLLFSIFYKVVKQAERELNNYEQMIEEMR